MTHWPGNRIGWSSDSQDADTAAARCTVYRYDAFGNRREARGPDGRTLRFGYDALHQLVEVRLRQKDGAGFKTIARYRYDAFGRRVAKQAADDSGTESSTYYGWDADRLVHTEDAQGIRHTVYQPDGFVPWLQLQRGTAVPDAVGTLLAMGDVEGDEDDQDGEKNMGASAMFAELPREQRETMQKTLHLLMDDSAAGTRTRARLQSRMPEAHGQQMVENLRLIRTAQAAAAQANLLVVRHYVCDHLGTPIGLIDADGPHAGKVRWAATYDAWGNVEQEFNPGAIDQPIRLQGQQFDKETGLHYNRFRFYDPGIGQYVTQDPIGLRGGRNLSSYTNQPILMIDPLGLEANVVGHPAGGPVGKLTNPNSYHLAIELIPDDKDCDLSGTKTLGGQPSGNFANGNLVSRPNYPGDSKNIDVRQAIQKPAGMTDCDFMKKLKKASEEYCNCLPYSKPNVSLIPGTQDGQMASETYNSNSYVSGVITRAGGVPPTLNTGGNWQAPGYQNALPIKNLVAPVGSVDVK